MQAYRRVLRALLVVAMVLVTFPATLPMPVPDESRAAAETTDVSSTNDVFSALGFDTSGEGVEGYDADSTDNPYGRNKFSANKVDECFMLQKYNDGGTWKWGRRLIGQETTASPSEIAAAAVKSGAYGDVGSYYPFGGTLCPGDFDGDGRPGEMAFVQWTGGIQWWGEFPFLSVYPQMMLLDSSGAASAPIPLIAPANALTDGDLGSGNVVPEELQNVMRLATGDFDGDQCAEIAVYVPEPGKARVDVYKYMRTAATPENGWMTASNWRVTWSYPISSAKYWPNMVSLCAGDFNKDGVDDLAISHGNLEYDGVAAYTPKSALMPEPGRVETSTAVALFGSTYRMLQKSQVLLTQADGLVRAAFTFEDIQDDGQKELVLGAQPASDIEANDRRVLGVYDYDGTSLSLSASLMKVVDGQTVQNQWQSNNGFDDAYCSMPIMLCNLGVTTPEAGGQIYVYLDSVLYACNGSTFTIAAELDDPHPYGDNRGPGSLKWCKTASGPDSFDNEYWEWGAAVGDMAGRAGDTLTSEFACFITSTNPDTYYRDTKVLYAASATPVREDFTNDSIFDAAAASTQSNHAACFPNTDENDTILMRYTGVHSLRYSDPQIFAALASPPYFRDIAESSDYLYAMDDLETSWGKSDGTGAGSIRTWSTHVGLWLEVNGDIGFQVKVRGEVGWKHEYEWENMKTWERTVTYAAQGGEDGVVLYSVPVENWLYQVLIPEPDGTFKTSYTTISIPHQASVQVLTLDDYEAVRADYASTLPPIRGTVLKHTVGDPSTYPSTVNGYTFISPEERSEWDKVKWASVGYGYGSIRQELTYSESDESAHLNGGEFRMELGGGSKILMGGGYFGVEDASGEPKLTLSGSSYEGVVKNLPPEFEPYGYHFAWKMFAATYKPAKAQQSP